MVKKRKRNATNKTENDVQQPETKKNKKDLRQYLTDPETGESIPLTKSGHPDMRCSKSKKYMERLNTSNNTNSDADNSSINDCSQNATFNDSSFLSSSTLLHHHTLNHLSSKEDENTNISLHNTVTADTSPSSSSSIILSSSPSSVSKTKAAAAVPSSDDISEMCKLKCNQTDLLPSTLSALLEKLKLYEKQQGQNGSQESTMFSSSSTQTDLIQMLKQISYSPFSVQTDPIPNQTKSAQTSNPCSVPLVEATTQTDDIPTKLRHVETQYHYTLHRFPISTQTPTPPTTQTTGTQTSTMSNSSKESTRTSESEAEEEEEEDKNLDFCRVV